MAHEGEQSTSATTLTHSSATARANTLPMPIRCLPSWPQIYSFDHPLLEQPDFDQPSSDSNKDALVIPTTQTQNPTHALSTYQTFALPLNVPAPQATAKPTHAPLTYQPFAPPLNAPAPQAATNISAPAPQPTQSSMMAVTRPAAMPPPWSHHVPSFIGKGGDSLNDFLCEYEEIANGHRLTE
jgi:hypothetical protein